MSELFLKLFNMSLTAGWLIGAVILLRFLFKKAPKWIFCLLWGLAALRLILPFSFESRVSLVPSAEVLPQSSIVSTAPAVDTGIPAVNEAINPVITESLSPAPVDSVNPLQVILEICSAVWLAGVCVMLLYAFFSRLRLQRLVKPRLRLRDNIYYCDRIDTPFILGVVKPKIYIPSSLPARQQPLIIAHEQAHLKRLDHLWKPVGFGLLAVYWFNPLIWVAYILLCRDIEQACDEKVIKDMDAGFRADYSEALFECSIHRRSVLACPLAFGEVGVKERIKSVLHYKKPAFWFLSVTVAVSMIAAICFLTNPARNARELNAVRKATSARSVFMSAFGKYEFADFSSDCILDCWIDENYKLHILLNESAKTAEPALDELLKDYRSIVVYDYTTMTEASLEDTAQAIGDALTAQGYPVTKTASLFNTRRITITMDDGSAIIAAGKWVKEQKDYPFNLPHVSIRFLLNDGKKRSYPEYSEFVDYTQESFYKSEAAAEALLAFLKEQGGYLAYRDYYEGYHIDADNRLHIYLKVSGSEEKHEELKAGLADWADVITYDYGGYPEDEVRQYHDDLREALTELGLVYTGGSIHGNEDVHGSGHAYVCMLYEDIPVAMSLMGKKNPYPFGNTDFQVIFAYRGMSVTMGDEMPPAETEPTETPPSADSAALSPIVIHHSIFTYESGSTPEEAARSVVENLDDSIRIISVAYSPQLTQLNLLLPVDAHRLAVYRYTPEFMEEHFKVVKVSCTYNGNEMLYTLKTVQNPETGIWEIWDFYAQEVK